MLKVYDLGEPMQPHRSAWNETHLRDLVLILYSVPRAGTGLKCLTLHKSKVIRMKKKWLFRNGNDSMIKERKKERKKGLWGRLGQMGFV